MVKRQGRPAGAPFAYQPPSGFVEIEGDEVAATEGARVWALEGAERKNFDGSSNDEALATRIILHHSNMVMRLEEVELSRLANDMPKVFEGSCKWTHRRHEVRVRSDGARVGLIEGDCTSTVDLEALGLPSRTSRARKLQLMFPDDTGTSIVTASFPSEQAARYEPLLEATIESAKGVATRAPSTSPWMYGAWAAAGLLLGWFATAIARREDPVPRRAR